MDLDDIPVLRHLGMFTTIAQAVLVFSGFLLFPILVCYSISRMRASPYVNERLFFLIRSIAWGLVLDMYLIIMVSLLYNMFNGFLISPERGQWLYLSWFFSDAKGPDLMFAELGLLAALIPIFFFGAWLIGSLNSTDEFYPRFYRRMY